MTAKISQPIGQHIGYSMHKGIWVNTPMNFNRTSLVSFGECYREQSTSVSGKTKQILKG